MKEFKSWSVFSVFHGGRLHPLYVTQPHDISMNLALGENLIKFVEKTKHLGMDYVTIISLEILAFCPYLKKKISNMPLFRNYLYPHPCFET